MTKNCFRQPMHTGANFLTIAPRLVGLGLCPSLRSPSESFVLTINVLIKTAQQGPLYINTVVGTLAVDGWAVTFGTVRRGLGWSVCRELSHRYV